MRRQPIRAWLKNKLPPLWGGFGGDFHTLLALPDSFQKQKYAQQDNLYQQEQAA